MHQMSLNLNRQPETHAQTSVIGSFFGVYFERILADGAITTDDNNLRRQRKQVTDCQSYICWVERWSAGKQVACQNMWH